MGEVYLADDTSLKRKVALKFLPDYLQEDDIAHKRFLREAQSAAAIDHPYICNIHEVSQTYDGQDFIVMEYVEGQTLRQKLSQGMLPLDEALRIGIEASEALEEAHKKGVVHRDLKPANIMLTAGGHVKVMDFGLAKKLVDEDRTQQDITAALTREGAALGTLAYMSPEQLGCEMVDTRTDIFSLGIVIYELLSGDHPFRRTSHAKTMAAILHEEPAPLSHYGEDTSEVLQHTISKMLAKDTNERYQSVHEVRSNLGKILSTQDSGAVPPRSFAAKRRIWPGVAAALAVIVALVLAVVHFYQAPIDSVAVLRFETQGNHPELEILGEGIPGSIIDKLCRVSGLMVSSRLSSFRFDPDADIQTVSDELGIRAVVTGQLISVREEFSVRVQLVDTDSNSQLWGNDYSWELSEIFSTQRAIAAEIGQALQLQLTADQKNRMVRSDTEDPEAYLRYLKGRRLLPKLDHLEQASIYFQEALAADPDYAPAYSGLARITSTLAVLGWRPLRELLPEIRELNQEALKLDDSLSEVHVGLGWQRVLEHDWIEAEKQFRRAIELDPNNAGAYVGLAGYCLSPLGRLDEAISEMKKAIQLDPRSVWTNFNAGEIYLYAGDYNESVRHLKLALDIDPEHWPSHWYLAKTYLQKQMFEKARTEFYLTDPDNCPACPPEGGRNHPYVYAALGERERALELLEGSGFAKDHPETTYAALGEIDLAFHWLEKNLELQRNGGSFSFFRWCLKVDPVWEPLRSDPRFEQLLRKLNMPEEAVLAK